MDTHFKSVLIAATVGALCSWGVITALQDDSAHLAQVAALESKILDLELALSEKEQTLVRARDWSWEGLPQTAQTNGSEPIQKQQAASKQGGAVSESATPTAAEIAGSPAQDVQQTLKDLSTVSDRDPRSFADKVTDLLAKDAGETSIAIASQGIADMAGNPELLPDQALRFLHQSQDNPDIKRVAAQVLSARGDNTLMDKHIADAALGLTSANAGERQKTLVELAKTRYAGAAPAIAPLLNDDNVGVKLDALLALGATGNQSHVHWVQPLINHPDPSVSWLAKDVVSRLQNLSDKARTQLATNDIAAELPFLAPQ